MIQAVKTVLSKCYLDMLIQGLEQSVIRMSYKKDFHRPSKGSAATPLIRELPEFLNRTQ